MAISSNRAIPLRIELFPQAENYPPLKSKSILPITKRVYRRQWIYVKDEIIAK